VQRRPSEALVAEDVAGAAVLHLERRLQAELLEGANPLGCRALYLLKLNPVVEGEDPRLRGVASSRPRLVAQCTRSSSGSFLRSGQTTPRSRKNSSSVSDG
jgi:hypothetical protein